MHKLTRGHAPPCLANYQHGRDNWAQVTASEKRSIWAELDSMQGQRCAYCEADISHTYDKHIEHFHQKGRDPRKTFEWSNLFGSCNRPESCGKHKDAYSTYNQSDLIKPDVEDPEHFFLFVSDGTIAIRAGLPLAERHRAEQTLRIFNLDAQHGALRHMRQQAAAGYIQTSETLYALANEYPTSEIEALVQSELQSELANTAHLPFATTIKHTLLPQKVAIVTR